MDTRDTQAHSATHPIPAPVMDEFDSMIRNLTDLQHDLSGRWAEVETQLRDLEGVNKESARNLVHYLALRTHDLRELQNHLSRHGISSLGRAEPYVMTNINKVLKLLHRITGRHFESAPGCAETLGLDEGRTILRNRTSALLGAASVGRKVRIMVTLPREAAENYALVRDLIAGGMDCARINCAHDTPGDWERMIENVRRGEREVGHECRISMDIAGPKLRTGPLQEGPRVLKLSPDRDIFGRVTDPACIWLTPAENPEASTVPRFARITLPQDFLRELRIGDRIKFVDARGSRRSIMVTEIVGSSVIAQTTRTSYIVPESKFKISRHTPVKKSLEATPGDIPALELSLHLNKGDSLILTRSHPPGMAARLGPNGKVVEPARIPCTLSEVFDDVSEGESIWLDDGKIGGVITSVSPNELLIHITQAGPNGHRLRADKGVNLPDSCLRLPALTGKDLRDLEFIVRHPVDLVGYSFVRSASDVAMLQEKLKGLGGEKLGIILKIETRRSFENLPEILLVAMNSPSVGVMIARGDLAVETGFERLSEVQEEILWMCEAAHVPVIWATQVLEQLSKKGIHSRAEITDAAMSERAECVMLNKGDYVVAAVHALDDILTRMQAHQDKKRAMLRHLHLADNFFAAFRKHSLPAAKSRAKL
jgi:pyruvate kinase